MAQRNIDPNYFPNFGISRQRNSFTSVIGNGGVNSNDGSISGGFMGVLAEDLARAWPLFAGEPIAGNELIDETQTLVTTQITKQFFSQISLNRPSSLNGGGSGVYAGVANFSQVGNGTNPEQHVMIFQTTNQILPKSGAVARGIDQNYRIRFEFDLRPRLFGAGSNSTGDREFNSELYQLNLRMASQGRPQYQEGNTVLEAEYQPSQYHPGYSYHGILNSGWEFTAGIPNPMYGWFKVNVGTTNQISTDGTISNPQLTTDGLITLKNGSTVDTSIIRMPGELVDLHFDDVTITADVANTGPYFVFGQNTNTGTYGVTQGYYYPVYLDKAAADQADISAGGTGSSTVHTFSEYPLATFYMPDTGSSFNQSGPPSGTDYKKYVSNRSIRFRNKRKGCGWFKRFPKMDAQLQGTYPFSYRLTMTEKGIVLYIYDDAAADQADDYSWLCIQRTSSNESGLPRTDEASKFPVHCMYSCSRESFYSSDAGIYFSSQAANLQTAEDLVDTVFDEAGNTYNLSNMDNSKTFYILSPYDREDYLADEWQAKNIWRFVVREFDVLKPTDVHKFATKHQTDSNAVINPLEQLAITDENRFIITFPTGLTTQRYMYPKEEMDMICFSSAEVVAESSNVPMTTYLYNGTNADQRRYQGMRSTMAFGNGMRLLVLVNGQYIFNSDINLDTYDPVGTPA
jgi:hypothetical protein